VGRGREPAWGGRLAAATRTHSIVPSTCRINKRNCNLQRNLGHVERVRTRVRHWQGREANSSADRHPSLTFSGRSAILFAPEYWRCLVADAKKGRPAGLQWIEGIKSLSLRHRSRAQKPVLSAQKVNPTHVRKRVISGSRAAVPPRARSWRSRFRGAPALAKGSWGDHRPLARRFRAPLVELATGRYSTCDACARWSPYRVPRFDGKNRSRDGYPVLG
jgi:hypothetical protein